VSPLGTVVVGFAPYGSQIAQLTSLDPLTGQPTFTIDLPQPGVVNDVTFDPSGNIYVSLNGFGLIRVSPRGVVTGQSEVATSFGNPGAIEFGADGRLYVSQFPNPGALLVVDPDSLAVLQEGSPGFFPHLYAYGSGVVAVESNGAQFFAYDDLTNSTTVTYGSATVISDAAVSPNGTVFGLLSAGNSVGGGWPCDGVSLVTLSPDGTSSSFSVAGAFAAGLDPVDCRVADIEAMPQGGAAIAAVSGLSARIAWLSDDGSVEGSDTREFESGLDPLLTGIHVDGAGLLTFATTVTAPCPSEEFSNRPCAAVHLAGYSTTRGVVYTRTIADGGATTQTDDDSVELAAFQHLRPGFANLFVGDGFVALPGARASFFCGSACFATGAAYTWEFVDAPTSRRYWEDPPAGVRVSPSEGPTGTTFSFSYSCSGSPSLALLDSTDQLAQGMSIGPPVIGNFVDYTQAVTANKPGIFHGRLACNGLMLDSADVVVIQASLCGEAAVVGVRGSGDNANGSSCPGRHAIAVANLLQKTWGIQLWNDNGNAVDGVIGLAYPAVAVGAELVGYKVSVDSGVASLLSELGRIQTACGADFPVLLVGFSQGAHVIQSTLEKLNDAPGDGRNDAIGGVVLLASPRFDPSDPLARGTFVADWPHSGVAGSAPIPDRFASISRTFCLDNDPVCVASTRSIGGTILRVNKTHTEAYNSETASGQPLLEDASGMLAWAVLSRLGTTAAPLAVGELGAYRQSAKNDVRVSAASIYGRGEPTTSFSWDFTNDGTVDFTSSLPWVTHSYGLSLLGLKSVITKVTIEHADGHVTIRTLCIRKTSFGGASCSP
jgi:hypothetical protein